MTMTYTHWRFVTVTVTFQGITSHRNRGRVTYRSAKTYKCDANLCVRVYSEQYRCNGDVTTTNKGRNDHNFGQRYRFRDDGMTTKKAITVHTETSQKINQLDHDYNRYYSSILSANNSKDERISKLLHLLVV